jgi:hypothetical protein
MANEELHGVVDERLEDDRLLPALPRISWGAILGGTFAALGIWTLMYAFGLAVGMSSVDPNDPGSLKGSGVFAGIWGLVAPLIALFVGGFVAGRLAGVFTRGHGAIHGLIMWGLATVAGIYLVVMTLSSLVAGAGRLAGSAAGAGLAGLGSGAMEQLDWNDALAPVNQRLRAQGKPALTADQVKDTAQDTVRAAMRGGRVDRNALESSLAQNTALSRADVQEISGRIETQVDEAKRKATMGALEATDATGKAFWGVFGALALGLVSALVGGALGVARPGSRRGDHRPRAASLPRARPAVPRAPEAHPQY